MRMCLPFILLSLAQFSSACVFQDPIVNQTQPSYEQKSKALLDAFPSSRHSFEEMLTAMKMAAGPFNVADVSIRSSWNNKQQGADWPARYPQCGGSMQSPINIVTKQTSRVALPPLVFKGYTNSHPNMTIINNGHTVDIAGPWGVRGDTIPTLSGGILKGTYQLYRVHFHWGYGEKIPSTDGSEHTINSVAGAMEMHYVHFNTKYADINAAMAADDPESLAVIGIIFKSSLFTSLRARLMFETLKLAVDGKIIFPAIFPLDLVQQKGSYFSYQGSLTTPDCIEKVRWIVMENILNVSERHLNIFPLFRVNGEPIRGNYRKTQPLNGRKVIRASVSKFR